MTYSKPKVTLEKYTLAEAVMADNYSMPVIEEGDPESEISDASVSNSTLNAFGEVLDFSKK